MQRPFDVRAYLCRALLAQIKLIASLMPNHGMRALDMVDHRSHLLPDLTRTLDILINEVLHPVHEIEKSRGHTESSILDGIERVILTRKKFRPNSPPTGLVFEYRKAFRLDCLDQRGWMLGKAIFAGLTVYVKEKLESDPRYIKNVYGRPPLHLAMHDNFPSPDMVRLLLHYSASPNQEQAGTTPWSKLLYVIQLVEPESKGGSGDWAELIDVMVGAGANPDPNPFGREDATIATLKRFCTPSDVARTRQLGAKLLQS
ncbi:hypothetical protein HO133_003583 [Letharia lupina]|uniref:Ankyrin repeat protein n=1 Tax=Letharia lupina TaxID=560253 RepID=A0A8H6CAI7_9LECA|nr:uncharacterized protein HO133_003583 [Letharia lupina]KAF6219758.1 hypothetical protein HO133_003583 [Letharia lupina]